MRLKKIGKGLCALKAWGEVNRKDRSFYEGLMYLLEDKSPQKGLLCFQCLSLPYFPVDQSEHLGKYEIPQQKDIIV